MVIHATTLFFSCPSSLQSEPIMKQSPRGRKVVPLLIYIEQHCQDHVTDFAVFLVAKLNVCTACGKKHRFPSASHGCIWSAFYELRNSAEVKDTWMTLMSMAKLPKFLQKESQFALQIIMDRIIKKILANEANSMQDQETAPITPLTMLERSAICYMAWYVAIKLLKSYGKPSTHLKVQRRHELFVRVLKVMRATHQPNAVETFQ